MARAISAYNNIAVICSMQLKSYSKILQAINHAVYACVCFDQNNCLGTERDQTSAIHPEVNAWRVENKYSVCFWYSILKIAMTPWS